MKTIHYQTAVLLLLLSLFSCEKESGYRFAGMPDEDDEPLIPPVTNGEIPPEEGLLFHENFQLWKRDGYDNLPTGHCEDDQMTTAMVMYVPSRPRIVQYNSLSVAYTLKDFAVNPVCGTSGGSLESEVSDGFIALQQLIFYECGQHDSDGMMHLSPLPSVGRIRFSLSLGGRIEDVAGITLWKKSNGASSFTRVGDYLPRTPEEGEVFSVEINETNVELKFVPALTGKEIPVNDGVNRAVRIHDLWVWSMDDH